MPTHKLLLNAVPYLNVCFYYPMFVTGSLGKVSLIGLILEALGDFFKSGFNMAKI